MFDIGWSELLIIAIVLIVVVGPKDLPHMLRQFGRTTSKLRAMGSDFRRQFDDALREAELDDVKDTLSAARNFNPVNEIRKHLSPIEEVGQEVRAGLDDVMKPMSKPEPSAEPVAEEPLKVAATALPGEGEAAPARARKSTAARKGAAAAAKSPAKSRAPARSQAKAEIASEAKPATRSKKPVSKAGASTASAAAPSAAAAKKSTAAANPAVSRGRAKVAEAKAPASSKATVSKVSASKPAKPAVAKAPAKKTKTGSAR